MRSVLQDPAFLRVHYYDDPVTGELHAFAPQAYASYSPPSYGQEDGGGQPPGGGAPGGGDASAVGGILQAVGGIIMGIGQVVYMGRMTESEIFTNVADYQDDWDERITLVNAITQKANTYKSYLRQKSNRKQWQTGPGARTTKKPNRYQCPRVYTGGPRFAQVNRLSCGKHGNNCKGVGCGSGSGHSAPTNWWGRPADNVPTGQNPGGHACGDPACGCPTSSCAFKNPAKAQGYKLWLRKGLKEGWSAGRMNTGSTPHLAGRGRAWEIGWLREAWTYLMTLAPVVTLYNAMNPGKHISIADGRLQDPNNIRLIYPDSDGIPPVPMQRHWWNTIMSIYETGMRTGDAILTSSPYGGSVADVPPWVFGYSEAEVRALFPDNVVRRSVFTTRFLFILMRDKQNKLLIAAGVDPSMVYAGEAYGAASIQDALADTPMSGGNAPPEEMAEWIEDVANSPAYRQQLQGVDPRTVGPSTKPSRQLSDTMERKMVRWNSAHRLGEEMGDELRNEPSDSQDTFAVKANYTPLYAGLGIMAAATTLGFLKR